jgi:ferredoxin--NADP+ reductase
MAKIEKKEKLCEKIWRYRIDAPEIAGKTAPGQFLIIRPIPLGERIPIAISATDAGAGWVEFVFESMGKTTLLLSELREGNTILEVDGPYGNPFPVRKYGTCIGIATDIGIAALLPVLTALRATGNTVWTVAGSDIYPVLLLADELRAVSDRIIEAEGIHRGCIEAVDTLLETEERIGVALVIGTPSMMKSCSRRTLDAGIQTLVSLSPVMLDDSGKCRGCRVMVDGEVKYACTDGPEFDASKVDWDELIQRTGDYNFSRGKEECKLLG